MTASQELQITTMMSFYLITHAAHITSHTFRTIHMPSLLAEYPPSTLAAELAASAAREEEDMVRAAEVAEAAEAPGTTGLAVPLSTATTSPAQAMDVDGVPLPGAAEKTTTTTTTTTDASSATAAADAVPQFINSANVVEAMDVEEEDALMSLLAAPPAATRLPLPPTSPGVEAMNIDGEVLPPLDPPPRTASAPPPPSPSPPSPLPPPPAAAVALSPSPPSAADGAEAMDTVVDADEPAPPAPPPAADAAEQGGAVECDDAGSIRVVPASAHYVFRPLSLEHESFLAFTEKFKRIPRPARTDTSRRGRGRGLSETGEDDGEEEGHAEDVPMQEEEAEDTDDAAAPPPQRRRCGRPAEENLDFLPGHPCATKSCLQRPRYEAVATLTDRGGLVDVRTILGCEETSEVSLAREKYARTALILFKHWRRVEDLQGDHATIWRAFRHWEENDAEPMHKRFLKHVQEQYISKTIADQLFAEERAARRARGNAEEAEEEEAAQEERVVQEDAGAVRPGDVDAPGDDAGLVEDMQVGDIDALLAEHAGRDGQSLLGVLERSPGAAYIPVPSIPVINPSEAAPRSAAQRAAAPPGTTFAMTASDVDRLRTEVIARLKRYKLDGRLLDEDEDRAEQEEEQQQQQQQHLQQRQQ
jgi:hypothetical protein